MLNEKMSSHIAQLEKDYNEILAENEEMVDRIQSMQ